MAAASSIDLPRLLLIADRFTEPLRAERVVEAVEAGVRWVQLRDHEATDDVFAAEAVRLSRRLRAVAPALRLSINTRLPVAQTLGVGLHVGRRGPSVEAARRRLGSEVVLGYSAHSHEAVGQAAEGGANYCLLSPIFPTSSKPGHEGLGLDRLRTVCTSFPGMPVYALGGVTPGRVPACIEGGAHGIAVLSGILAAPDVAAAVQAYYAACEGKGRAGERRNGRR